MNKIIVYLILSDILILSAFGLISPIFAIYLDQGLAGGIAAAGLASMIYLLVKSAIQLPLSIYIDSRRGKLGFLLIGTFLIVIVPVIYGFSPNLAVIYIAQAVYGIGSAMAYPAWYCLFTMHLDKKHRGMEYSLWSTGVGIGTAITAYLGAVFAQSFGFKNLFFIVAGISFLGLFVLFLLSNKFIKDIKETEKLFIEKTGNILNHRKEVHTKK